MSRNSVQQITKKSKTMLTIVNFLYWASIFLTIGISIIIIIGTFLSDNIFHIEKSAEFWFINISSKEGEGFFIGVPFKILPSYVNETTIVAKSIFMTMLSFFLLPFFLVFVYGVRQIKLILESMSNKQTPFVEKNALRLKKLAWTVIIYSLVGKLFINFMMILFVTKMIPLHINVDFTGVFVGASLLIIANIFQYGSFLQEEYDTTI